MVQNFFKIQCDWWKVEILERGVIRSLSSSGDTESLLYDYYRTQSKSMPAEKEGGQASGFMHVNSLFKVGEPGDVDSQLDNLLGLMSTVLDDTHPGLISCKLERKSIA